MSEVIDKAKDMPKLILHNWNFDKDVVRELRKMGYYDDTIYPEEFPEDEDLKECTALATVGFYWVFWEYNRDPSESDPGIMNFSDDEFMQDGSPESAYWKDYFDCGEDKELFLKMAKYNIPK